MTDILWRKTGKGVLTEDGCPILCDKCPCSEECYSWVHYAPGMSTAEQKLNRLTLEVNGHSFEMELRDTAFYDSATPQFADGGVIAGLGGGRTGHGYVSTFQGNRLYYGEYEAEIKFYVYEDLTSSDTGSSGFRGRFFNAVEISGYAYIDDILYTVSGYWRNLTNAPISEGGSVENGVPLPFDLAVSVGNGTDNAPSSMNLPGYNRAWGTSATGEWTIGPARYDSTVQCNMRSYQGE